MSGFNTMAARFFTWLGIALLALAPFIAPEFAFADMGKCFFDCDVKCAGDPSCLKSCKSVCCGDNCNVDQTCQDGCCKSICMGDSTCEQDCKKVKDRCLGSPTCEWKDKRGLYGCFIQGPNCDGKTDWCDKLGAPDCATCICTNMMQGCYCLGK